MTLEDKNQNDIVNSSLLDSLDIEYVFSDKPINRFKTKPVLEDKTYMLEELKKEIEIIENCELKKNSISVNMFSIKTKPKNTKDV